MRHVFLSYRRDDTPYITGFIYRELTGPSGFGPDSVFMDIDTIPPGVDFRELIDEHVKQCRFFLTVIGKQWVTLRGDDGQVRLHNPNDWVRLEIEMALRRDIPVVPVLVEGAKMPKKEELPESLHPLLFKNATTIRPGKWFGPDVEELVKGLQKAEEWKQRKATPVSPPSSPPVTPPPHQDSASNPPVSPTGGPSKGLVVIKRRTPQAITMIETLWVGVGDGERQKIPMFTQVTLTLPAGHHTLRIGEWSGGEKGHNSLAIEVPAAGLVHLLAKYSYKNGYYLEPSTGE